MIIQTTVYICDRCGLEHADHMPEEWISVEVSDGSYVHLCCTCQNDDYREWARTYTRRERKGPKGCTYMRPVMCTESVTKRGD